MFNINKAGENKLIEKNKKFTYKFFWNKFSFSSFLFIFGFTPFYEFVKSFCDTEFQYFFYVLYCIVALITYLICNSISQKPLIEPLEKSRHFVGIYNVDDLNSNKDYYDDILISRINEVNSLKDIINDILTNKSIKHSICIVGESGSGKSTIINRLQNELDDINVINCTERYKDLKNIY